MPVLLLLTYVSLLTSVAWLPSISSYATGNFGAQMEQNVFQDSMFVGTTQTNKQGISLLV